MRSSDAVGDSETLEAAFDWFAGYLVLDALVGNTDRHQDNWATIRSPSGERLAPSFDHASCLGFQLSDAERLERLTGTTNRTVGTYAAAARTKFERRPSPIDAAVEALALTSGRARRHWIRAIDNAPDLDDLVGEIPDHRMGEPARQFAVGLYLHNRGSLSHALRRMST